MYPNPRNVAVFVNGAFKEIHRGLITPEVASAYVSGLMLGAQYGAVKLVAYVLPDDEESMRNERDTLEVERALQENAKAA